MLDFANWLSGEKISVIDIGARLTPGEVPIYENLIQHDICKVTAVEPDSSTNHLLEKLPNARIYNLTLGTKGYSYLNICKLPSCSSLLTPNIDIVSRYSGMEYFYKTKDRISVHVDEMDDIFQDDHFDFLSIDVQGAELDVLQHGKRNLSNLLGVHIEVSFIEKYKGQPLFRDVDAFLSNNKTETLVPVLAKILLGILTTPRSILRLIIASRILRSMPLCAVINPVGTTTAAFPVLLKLNMMC